MTGAGMADDTVRAPLEVDREALLELARGGNLYQERFACMRELVQNAVDATLLRLFAERGTGAFPTNERSMRDLRAALSAYPIDVTITREPGEDGALRYRITVADHGTGIARSDVPHLQRIGSSRKNPARAALIAAMPEWMRPSGTFGIGLQSAFLVSDELVLRSRHASGEALDVILRAADGGSVEVRDGGREEIGTTAELVVRVTGEQANQLSTHSYRAAMAHDWMLDPPFDGPIVEALTLARALAEGAVGTIRVNGEVIEPLWDDAQAVFDTDALVEVWLPTDDAGVRDPSQIDRVVVVGRTEMMLPRKRGSYRGAPLALSVALPEALPWRMNLHFGTARELLSLGRDALSSEGQRRVDPRLRALAQRAARAHLRSLAAAGTAPHTRTWLSVFLLSEGLAAETDDWRRYYAGDASGRALSLGELVDAGGFEHKATSFKLEATLADGTRWERTPSPLFHGAIDALFPGVHLVRPGLVTRAREPGMHVSMAYVSHLLANDNGWRPAARPFLPCPDEVVALVPAAVEHLGEHRQSLVSPWLFRDGVVTLPSPLRWIEWTAREHGGPPRDPAVVASALVRFLRAFDADLRANAALRVEYDLDAVIAEIERAYPPA